MNNINFTRLGGLPVTQYTLDFMQKTYQDMFNKMSNWLGDLVIVSGVEPAGLLLTDGLVCINGEMVAFVGGTATAYIDIFETIGTRLYEDGDTKDVYYTREAKSSLAPGYALADFVRLPRMSEVAPAGMMTPFAGSVAPSGWLLADGQEVSRSAYAKLFAVIGTTYGVGNGTTTFNVPNTKGRVVAGLDAAQVEFATLALTGGDKTHTLTTPQIPSHTHVMSYDRTKRGEGSDPNDAAAAPDGAHFGTDFTKTTAATGGGEAHNNLQPYITMPHIIKY